MIFDIHRKELPDFGHVAARARCLASLVKIVSSWSMERIGDRPECEDAALAFDLINDDMQELSAALDILDDFCSPDDFGFRTPAAEDPCTDPGAAPQQGQH